MGKPGRRKGGSADNAVKNEKAFKRRKLKLGKKLKKTTTTDTTISSKKLVVSAQLEERPQVIASQATTLRGFTLADMCKSMGHFNKNMRKDALMNVKQLLTSSPALLNTNLSHLVPAVGRVLTDGSNEPSFVSLLRSTLEIICTASSAAMSAHFHLLLAHMLRGLIHMQISVRMLCLAALKIVMLRYPELCRNNNELFFSMIRILGGSKKPEWNQKGFLEVVAAFVNVFDEDVDLNKNSKCIETSINVEEGTITDRVSLVRPSQPFDFPVLSSHVSSHASPFEVPEHLLSLSAVLAPTMYTVLVEDKSATFLAPTCSILSFMGRALSRQPNSFLYPKFKDTVREHWVNVAKAVNDRRSPSIQKSGAWMQVLFKD